MYLLAGLGSMMRKTHIQNNTIIAAFILYAFNYNVRLSSLHIDNDIQFCANSFYC